MKYYYAPFVVCLIFTVLLSSAGTRNIPSFPGAEGFGATTPGGRGGSIIHVINLNDHGAGSLRDACTMKGKRIVVFNVSGVIRVDSAIVITEPYITIAGESAAAGGITIAGSGKNFENGGLFTEYNDNPAQPVHDIIIRFIRIRGTSNNDQGDAVRLYNVNNAVVDHCSFGWAHDETADLSKSRNITFQWCIFNESIADGDHNTGVFHCYGYASNFTMHHCLLVHHKYRNPVLSSDQVDLRNNIIYNWRDNATHFDNINGRETLIPFPHRLTIIGNYYKQGPSWKPRPGEPIEIIPQYLFRIESNVYEWKNGRIDTDQRKLTLKKNWNQLKDNDKRLPWVTTTSAEQAYKDVLRSAGALPRDPLDKRNVEEVMTRTGGWCYTPIETALNEGTFGSRTVKDHGSGLEDFYERYRERSLKSGYDPIEEYLHDRAAEQIIKSK